MSKYFVVPHNMKPCDGVFSQSSNDTPPVFRGMLKVFLFGNGFFVTVLADPS